MRDQTPVASVVIPTRNRLPFLKEAIDSIRAQTQGGIEIIVVDDASDDGTHDWLSQQSVLRTVSVDVPGERSAARNRGLAEAHAPYVLFLDDDDRLTPDAIAVLVRAMRAHPSAVAAVGALEHFDVKGNRRREAHPRSAELRPAWAQSLFDWYANPGRNLVRTDVVRSIGGFDEQLRIAEDLDLWLRVARQGPVAFVPQIVLEARLHPGQTKIDDHRSAVDDVTVRHAQTLAPDEARVADRMRSARSDYWSAVDAISDGRPRSAARALARAVRTEPRLVTYPVARRRLSRIATKAAVGLIFGRRGLQGVRGAARSVRRHTKRDAWRSGSAE